MFTSQTYPVRPRQQVAWGLSSQHIFGPLGAAQEVGGVGLTIPGKGGGRVWRKRERGRKTLSAQGSSQTVYNPFSYSQYINK